MKKTAIIIGISTALTGASIADSDGGNWPQKEQNKYFDGFYTGLELGAENIEPREFGSIFDPNTDDTSLYYGLLFGYRMQMDNNWVFGVEGNFGDTTRSQTFDIPVSGFGDEGTKSTRHNWAALANIGRVFGEKSNHLVFARAGYTKLSERTVLDTLDDNASDGGWRFGGGYEHALSSSISLRATGDYITYGDDRDGWSGKAGLLLKF